MRIMRVNLASEMNVLARDFHRLSIGDWRTRDFTFNGMLAALEEVIAGVSGLPHLRDRRAVPA